MRTAIEGAFQAAHKEVLGSPRIFDSPVVPHVFVSQIRTGSLELQVIYQILMELPWREIGESAVTIGGHGLEIVKEIGALAPGVETLRRIGPWIRRHLNVQNQVSSDVTIREESRLLVDPEGLSQGNSSVERARELLDDSTPQALVVLLDQNAFGVVRQALRPKRERHHIGGHTILHDMNLNLNGVSDLEELTPGDPFCLHNASAIGLQRVQAEDSLFESCAQSNPSLFIEELTMDHAEFPEQFEIVEGQSLDIDEL